MSNAQNAVHKRQSHANTFAKVFDGRKQPIRGLWVRNGRYYAQLAIEDPNNGQKEVRRVPLLDGNDPVQTVAQAVKVMERLRTQRIDNDLPNLKRTPKFSDYVNKTYLPFIESGGRTSSDEDEEENDQPKKPGTISKEKSTLKKWSEEIGNLPVDKIRRIHINAFIQKRKKAGIKNRTVNLDVIALRNVLKHALYETEIIRSLPTTNMRPLKVAKKNKYARQRLTLDAIEDFCRAAFDTRTNECGETVPVTKNAQQFVDYIRFLAYTGARRNEALAIRKDDIDFAMEKVTIGADADTKNSTARAVDFNPKLKPLLLDMKTRWAPDSKWLFPSPQRGEKDIHAQSFRESLELVRQKAGMPHVGFHDFRHFFISWCVMRGIDYMTIAEWVGHKDGGILIGKVYGALNDEYRKAQAAKLTDTFGPVVVEKAEAI